jgi:hypothetical protein
MSEQFDLEKMLNEHDKNKDEILDLRKIIEDLEKQRTKPQLQTLQKISMSTKQVSLEDIEKCIITEPTKSEIIVMTTKIHSFDKPVFITMPGSKVYNILGKVPTLRTPEISAEDREIHIMNDEEMAYSVHSDIDLDDFMDIDEPESMPSEVVFVICGKFFGTRKLDALASILLKLDVKQIIIQKYSYNKNSKGAQWVPKHNEQVTKLEHHIHKFLRNNER